MTTTGLGLLNPAHAQTAGASAAQADQLSFDIPAQPLTEALIQFGRQARLQTSADASLIQDLRSAPVKGTMTWQQAVTGLLSGTGLTYRINGSMVTVEKIPAAGKDALQLGPVMVEGTAEQGRFGDTLPEPGGFKAEYQSTATKSAQTIRETPQAIGVVTQDSLKKRQVVSLGQALETVAGVTQGSEPGPFAGRSYTGFVTYQIRGVQTESYFDVREDGFLAPQQTGARDLAPYERVEVVKGPSSALYGRGAAGGFINLVRKKPLPELQVNGEASAGSFDFYRADGDITGPLLDTEEARGRLVVAYENAGSFVDGVKSQRAVVAPSLELDVGDSTRLLLQGTYQDDHFVPHYGFPLQTDGNNFKAPNVRRSLYFGVPPEDEDGNSRRLFDGTVQLDQEIGDNWLVNLRLSKSKSEGSQRLDNYAYGGLTPEGDVYVYAGSDDKEVDIWAGELLLNGSMDVLDRAVNITLGADHNDMAYTRRNEFVYLGSANIYADNFDSVPAAAIPPTVFTQDTDFRSHGVFGQVQFRPFDRLGVLLGGRYDWTEQSNTSTFAGDTEVANSEFEAFTGRGGLTFDITRQITAYGLYADIFTPNTFDVGRRGGGVLPPITGQIYEVGIKSDWLDGKLGVNASLYRIERDNVPIPDPGNGPGEFFSVPGGLQRADGIELEINGEPLPGWNVSFAGTLLDSKFIDRDDPNFGNSPTDAARWQIGFYTSYELQNGPLEGLGLGASLFAVDDRPVTPDSSGTIDGYQRVDLQAFYNGFEPFYFAVQVRNVFDETYVESLERPGGLNHFGAPRAFLVTARLQL